MSYLGEGKEVKRRIGEVVVFCYCIDPSPALALPSLEDAACGVRFHFFGIPGTGTKPYEIKVRNYEVTIER